ncbi:hypothetical protein CHINAEXTREME_20695 (plasmid) [Halobiforma lacisalsi AJ5]|uniref:Uncharacterized protein n=2 Tax=Natronobacterium lacisalsi TaxID=229731 RepID=M0L980_NATLA|nr:hypothetical protein [Halobiforma lacisalsi]APX00230.1 hypothetical protein CHINAEXTREME_20695 [Halobiforma lacisalsi AJ5]EMA30162.1 hypothetical protein C445_16689 [Halobiforma lacisalsi AJ5]
MRPEVRALTSGSLVGVENAEGAFIDGHYFASFLAATATIEQILREQLPDSSDYYYFSTIVTEAEEQDLLGSEAAARFSDLHELRNAHVHYRGEKGPSDPAESMLERSTGANERPKRIVKEDAELALQCLYEVLEIAKKDIPDGALPGEK